MGGPPEARGPRLQAAQTRAKEMPSAPRLYSARPLGGATEHAGQLESAGTYLREQARRGRWALLQLAL